MMMPVRRRARTAALFVLGIGLGPAAFDLRAQSTAIIGATLIDGTGREPVRDAVVILDGNRIRYAGPRAGAPVPERAARVDARGRYVIPGMMDGNVHLYSGLMPDNLKSYDGRFDELVLEAAQVALQHGVTSLFDTWGPREALVTARDRINSGAAPGSRIFVAGNIIGMYGPATKVATATAPGVLTPEELARFDAMWEQGVGADLLWRTPDQVRIRVRDYIATGRVDMVKYLSSDHDQMELIAFSPESQRAIVEEGRRAGLNVQAHTTSVESLRLAIEAGADLLQHCDVTGPEPIPAATIAAMVDRKLACAVGFQAARRMDWERAGMPESRKAAANVKERNGRALIRGGVLLLMATDGGLSKPLDAKQAADPRFAQMIGPDNSYAFPEAHLLWLKAAIEKGMTPMDALLGATRNVAIGYGRDKDLGTLEPGKRADLVILSADPLADPANYAKVWAVYKDGAAVDRARLPVKRIVTAEPGQD